MVRAAVLFLLLLGTSVAARPPADAQSAPVPGIDGDRLALMVDSMTIYVVRGQDTVPAGMLWDELTRVEENGVDLLHRVYRSRDRVLGMRVDTLVDHYSTLIAVRHRSRTARTEALLDFSEQRVVGWVRLPDGDSTAVDVAVPLAVYNGSSFDLVIRSAPLAYGWSADVPSFVASTRTVVPLRARVVSREQIDGEECWRVDGDFGGTPVSFWIQEHTRDLCQQVMQIGPEMQILFRRVTADERPRPEWLRT
jgi:hypothetical protein